MKEPLRVLIIEDSEADTLLVLRELKRGGFDPIFERVDSAAAMTMALGTSEWDAVVSDHSMPGFGSLEALRLLKQKGMDIPFIIVSAVIGEDVAVQAMKAGAHDYVMKGKLVRLVPAMERELREAANRRARRSAEEAMRRNHEALSYLGAIVESSDDAIFGKTLDGKILSWNLGAEKMYGYTADEMKGRSISILIPEHRTDELLDVYSKIKYGERIERHQTTRVRKDGTVIDVSLTLSPIKNATGEVVGVSAIERDITKRKREEQERLKLIDELTQALARIKTLKGLLPICASCKKIRDDRGYWQKVELYISQHTHAEFTHGICPECVQRLYPEYTLRAEADRTV
ncbi:MAG: putative sensor protein [Pedosphaera sp.]|nr:putative sensor protein [Pedosphaera sp.]